jgi:hypothetical protein
LLDTKQERRAEPELRRLRGTLLLYINEHIPGEAINVAQRQSAKFWELRAATSLGRLWRDQGKRTEARDLLAVQMRFTDRRAGAARGEGTAGQLTA